MYEVTLERRNFLHYNCVCIYVKFSSYFYIEKNIFFL
jgi:hypothetical protein